MQSAVNIPDFQMYDQALSMIEEKKQRGSPFLDSMVLINTLNNMANNIPLKDYNYHCYNIYRLLSVDMLRDDNSFKTLARNYKQTELGTAIIVMNLTAQQFELLSVYVEYYQ